LHANSHVYVEVAALIWSHPLKEGIEITSDWWRLGLKIPKAGAK